MSDQLAARVLHKPGFWGERLAPTHHAAQRALTDCAAQADAGGCCQPSHHMTGKSVPMGGLHLGTPLCWKGTQCCPNMLVLPPQPAVLAGLSMDDAALVALEAMQARYLLVAFQAGTASHNSCAYRAHYCKG